MSERREMTFEDVLRFAGLNQIRAQPPAWEDGTAEIALPAPPAAAGQGTQQTATRHPAATAPTGEGCGSGGCGCRAEPPTPSGAGNGGAAAGPRGIAEGGAAAASRSLPVLPATRPAREQALDASGGTLFEKPVNRRGALGILFGTVAAGSQALSACSPANLLAEEEREARLLAWREYIKGNYRLMTERERADTVERLERLAQIRRGEQVHIRTTQAQPGVVYGYAFNIDKCKGFRNCIEACVQENNLDRRTGTHYIRIFEMQDGVIDLDHADATYHHEVPAEGHFYLGTQCFQCANPPCVPVCPVQATWQEPDGIVVVDYDWCIGCRYCVAACPYWARRFNWSAPEVPREEVNSEQHYLGNRARKNGVVEKCTFCIQRTREGRLPACAEACPTGARVFGNLLDPDSEIRWVLANKRVFRLKEELYTEPRFWYFTD